MKTINTVV